MCSEERGKRERSYPNADHTARFLFRGQGIVDAVHRYPGQLRLRGRLSYG